MTDFAFSDCIRSTPGRTLVALAIAVFDHVVATLRHPGPDVTIERLSDRDLADIGLRRWMQFDTSEGVQTGQVCGV